MTEAEIYNRTAFAVSEQLHREFGSIHARPIGQASAQIGFAETLIDSAIERYIVTRRRRPWCRVPWQKQTGRRASPDPMKAKKHRYPMRWWKWCVDTSRWVLTTPAKIADSMAEKGSNQ
jgi:hypothetical protein